MLRGSGPGVLRGRQAGLQIARRSWQMRCCAAHHQHTNPPRPSCNTTIPNCSPSTPHPSPPAPQTPPQYGVPPNPTHPHPRAHTYKNKRTPCPALAHPAPAHLHPLDAGYHQTIGRGHGDADVDCVVLHDGRLIRCQAGIHQRMVPQRQRGGLWMTGGGGASAWVPLWGRGQLRPTGLLPRGT